MVERVRDIGQRHIAPAPVHPVGQHRRQSRPCAPASCPRPPSVLTAGASPEATGTTHIGALLEHHMRIGAAEPERRHARPRRRPVAGQSVGSATTFSRSSSNGMCGLGFSKCRLAGIVPRCTASTALIRPDDARRRLQVTQIRLDGADQQRRVRRPSTTQHRPERPGFDGIAQQRSGSVGLDVVDLARLRRRHWRRRRATPPSARPGSAPSARWTGRPD